MVGRAVVGAVAVTAGVNAVMAVSAWPLYAAMWSAPGATMILQAALLLVGFAVAITPEQRRDTRASRSPFRSNLTVVQIGLHPDGRPAPLTAPLTRPPVGMLVVQIVPPPPAGAPLPGRAQGMVVTGEVLWTDENREGS